MGEVTPQRFREVLGHVPTPVVVVTAAGPQGPVGLAIGSFVSVSLEPLLVGFFPAKTSSSWPIIRDAGRFCVNVLADDQTSLSQTFAARGGDKFESVSWRPGPSGAPVLEQCVVWIECDLDAEIDAGDHLLVLGRVTGLDLARDAHALVFHRGDYTSTAAARLAEGEG
ncbi:MAG: flavin reductase family protein [Actinomycetota bacterium]|nr:flavin reductase family protein [Actinomycetota bacterium]